MQTKPKTPTAAYIESALITGAAAVISAAPTYLAHLPWWAGLAMTWIVAPSLRALQAKLTPKA